MQFKNLFGTDGIRGAVGTSIFTKEGLENFSHALGQWIIKKHKSARVLIIHDTRSSCLFIKSIISKELTNYPITIYDGGILPTPAAAHLMRLHQEFTLAVIISASHNHWSDNGIKIIERSGKINIEDEIYISKYFYEITTLNRPGDRSNSQYCGQAAEPKAYSSAATDYIKQSLSYFSSNLLKDKLIILDCAHGATYQVAPTIFKHLGARVITLNNNPNGFNINDNCGALHPDALRTCVLEHQAYAGFAFDGDGDRVIAVNNKGEVKDGDDILALLSNHPDYNNQDSIVGTLMCNKALETYLNSNNKRLIRTNIGDKYVMQELIQENLNLGGEPAGHIIMRDIIPSGDGIIAALRVLETMQITHNHGFQTFEKYPQVLINMRMAKRCDLSQDPYAQIIACAQQELKEARILVRFSGTEPVLRIMVEAPKHEYALELAHKLKKQFAAIL